MYKAGLDVPLVVAASVGGAAGLLLMCLSLAALRRCRASSSASKTHAGTETSWNPGADSAGHTVPADNTLRKKVPGGAGTADMGMKVSGEGGPPPPLSTQPAPDRRQLQAPLQGCAAAVAVQSPGMPDVVIGPKRKLGALAPLPARVVPLEQVLSPAPSALPLPSFCLPIFAPSLLSLFPPPLFPCCSLYC